MQIRQTAHQGLYLLPTGALHALKHGSPFGHNQEPLNGNPWDDIADYRLKYMFSYSIYAYSVHGILGPQFAASQARVLKPA